MSSFIRLRSLFVSFRGVGGFSHSVENFFYRCVQKWRSDRVHPKFLLLKFVYHSFTLITILLYKCNSFFLLFYTCAISFPVLLHCQKFLFLFFYTVSNSFATFSVRKRQGIVFVATVVSNEVSLFFFLFWHLG